MVLISNKWKLLNDVANRSCILLRRQCTTRFCSSHAVQHVEQRPKDVYSKLVQDGTLKKDHFQEKVMICFDQLHIQLNDVDSTISSSNFLASLFNWNSAAVQPVKGLYIYGSVGCGKTMLMDLFFNNISHQKKKRVHFNEFMLDIHKRIHSFKLASPPINYSDRNAQPLDPIPPVAQNIANEIQLLCFDEFQVTDVADAMILKRLFECLFQKGVIVVATSNRKPEDLYKNGLQRVNFLPFIPMLKRYCDIIHLSSVIDYRRLDLSDIKDCYYDSTLPDEVCKLNEVYDQLCAAEQVAGHEKEVRTLIILGRKLKLEKTCGKVLYCTFEELCMKPLGAIDYITIANEFDTVILVDIPLMNAHRKVETRRFITLVDNFYDKNVRLICSAEKPIEELFVVGATSSTKSDSERMLMDDLGIAVNDKNSEASIFTAEEEIFAFERTKSRLNEMQTEQYWNNEK